MKIASFNVNSLRVRLPLVIQWLTDRQVDVLCVQETKVQDMDFPAQAFDEMGYNYAFKGQKTYNGVAIFSRHPIENIVCGFSDEPRDEARLIRAQVDGVIIVNSYVPQGYSADSDKFQYKLLWFERLLDYFRQNFSREDAVLWLGDLNIAPEPIDVYDAEALEGHVCFHSEVRAVLKKVMAWGFVDLFRQHCTEPGQYTFWDYRLRNPLKQNQGWRIDHLMATVPLARKCTTCYIDTEPRTANRPSDHTPLIAEFDLR